MATFATPSARWAAITSRDPAASNAFIYSVISTKIYCRPTCPARLARRANVIFHDSAAEAEAAGYRACMRCRPGDEDGSTGDPQRIAVEKARRLICEEGRGDSRGKWGIKDLAKEVGLTESHFCRVFKKVMGSTVGEYRARLAVERKTGSNGVPASKVAQDVHVAASPFDLQYPVAGLQDLDSFDPELAREWQDFGGNSELIADTFPGLSVTDFMSFDSSPALLSDSSTPEMTDDGFQFLNFDEIGTLTAP
jgi:methylphosphotriester-DNA--protein-cysteine methyltransferase